MVVVLAVVDTAEVAAEPGQLEAVSMASNLLKTGYQLTVWNRSVEKCEPFARKGARVADTPTDAVREVDLVMYCLSNDQAVEEVVFGTKGILGGIKEGVIAIDMSTVLPATSLREQEAYANHGVDFLDAPVFGSKQESTDAKLWIMAAGNKAIFEKVKPVLEHLGQTVHYFGKNGNATAMPTMCWIAPEIPRAMYTFGATV